MNHLVGHTRVHGGRGVDRTKPGSVHLRQTAKPVRIDSVADVRVSAPAAVDPAEDRSVVLPAIRQGVSRIGKLLRQSVASSRDDMARVSGRKLVPGAKAAKPVDIGPARRAEVDQRPWLLVGDGPEAREYLYAELDKGQVPPMSIVGSRESVQAERIVGVAVSGTIDQIPAIARRSRAERVVIVVGDVGSAAADKAFDLAVASDLDVTFVEARPTSNQQRVDELDRILDAGMSAA